MEKIIQHRQQLKEYSNDILVDDSFHDRLAPAIMGLSQFLFELADVRNNEEHTKHIGTTSGNAIGPFWAAACSREVFRTQRFIKSLHLAIVDKLKYAEGPVHVLYAGTGPFALLALPIMIQFSPNQVQFTLLEINAISFGKMNHCISQLGLNDYVKATHCVDATKYKVQEEKIDILISETMYNGLYREPQVSIMLNLVSQVNLDCIIIPEKIEVDLIKENAPDSHSKIACVISFDRKYMNDVISNSPAQQWILPKVRIPEPIDTSSKYTLTTYIQIYKHHILAGTDSSLNLPRRIHFPKEAGNEFNSIQYTLGELPHFQVV